VWTFAGAEPGTLLAPRRSIGGNDNKTSNTAQDTSQVRSDSIPSSMLSSLPPGKDFITRGGWEGLGIDNNADWVACPIIDCAAQLEIKLDAVDG